MPTVTTVVASNIEVLFFITKNNLIKGTKPFNFIKIPGVKFLLPYQKIFQLIVVGI